MQFSEDLQFRYFGAKVLGNLSAYVLRYLVASNGSTAQSVAVSIQQKETPAISNNLEYSRRNYPVRSDEITFNILPHHKLLTLSPNEDKM